jgi:hypothetical protein
VPKSRIRSKAVYTPPDRKPKAKVSPRWLVPAMLACLLVGLAWIALGAWNLAVGFVLIIAGVVLSTKWR